MRLPAAALALLVSTGCGEGATEGGGGEGNGGGAAGAAHGGNGGEGGSIPVELDAGFVALPPAHGAASKMFYALRPADEDPDHAPVLVFFNGGPGAATTSVLLPFGTGPQTLKEEGELGDPPVENPTSLTAFANLLYIDARSTGFSYDVGNAGCPYEGEPVAGDAADFIYALLEVLDSHPGLTNNRVIVVGESYGGTRAPVMLFGLQHYAVPADDSVGSLPDFSVDAPWLRDRMQAHVDLAFPDRAGEVLGPDDVADQFGFQVLIQPSIFGGPQVAFQTPYLQADPDFADFYADQSLYDPYDVRRTPEEGLLLFDRAAAAMRDPATFAKLIGVDPGEVPGLAARERGDALRIFERDDPAQVARDEASMREALGELEPADAYWLPLVSGCGLFEGDYTSLSAFAEILNRSHTFITDARYDSVVYTPALPPFFSQASRTEVTVDTSAPAGAARPGVIRIVGPLLDTSIRFPTYESGHEVTISAPAELAQDVRAWLEAEGAL